MVVCIQNCERRPRKRPSTNFTKNTDHEFRIAPNEISTCEVKAIPALCGNASNFVKTDFDIYQLRGVPELFTMSDRKQHASRRRQLSHLLSMSTITEYGSLVDRHVSVYMDLIAEQRKRGSESNLYN